MSKSSKNLQQKKITWTYISDECSSLEDCDTNAQCLYDVISQRYKCKCNHGYEGDGRSCKSLRG